MPGGSGGGGLGGRGGGEGGGGGDDGGGDGGEGGMKEEEHAVQPSTCGECSKVSGQSTVPGRSRNGLPQSC